MLEQFRKYLFLKTTFSPNFVKIGDSHFDDVPLIVLITQLPDGNQRSGNHLRAVITVDNPKETTGRVKTSLPSKSEDAVYTRPFDPSRPRRNNRFLVLTTRSRCEKSKARCYFGRPHRCLYLTRECKAGDDER